MARKFYLFSFSLPHYFLTVAVSRGGDKHFALSNQENRGFSGFLFALLFRSGNSDLAELQSAKNRAPQISRTSRCLAFSRFALPMAAGTPFLRTALSSALSSTPGR